MVRRTSPAGNHCFMTNFKSGLPPSSNLSRSSPCNLMFNLSSKARYSSFLQSMIALKTLKMGSRTNWQKPRVYPRRRDRERSDWLTKEELHNDCTFSTGLGPFLFRCREEVVPPQSFHQFVDFDFEFRWIHLGEFLQGESPAVKTSTETDCALGGIDLRKKNMPLYRSLAKRRKNRIGLFQHLLICARYTSREKIACILIYEETFVLLSAQLNHRMHMKETRIWLA